jgi:hypothetical protein
VAKQVAKQMTKKVELEIGEDEEAEDSRSLLPFPEVEVNEWVRVARDWCGEALAQLAPDSCLALSKPELLSIREKAIGYKPGVTFALPQAIAARTPERDREDIETEVFRILALADTPLPRAQEPPSLAEVVFGPALPQCPPLPPAQEPPSLTTQIRHLRDRFGCYTRQLDWDALEIVANLLAEVQAGADSRLQRFIEIDAMENRDAVIRRKEGAKANAGLSKRPSPPPPFSGPKDPRKFAEVKQLFKQGHPVSEVHKRTRIPRRTLYRWRKQ